MKCEQALQMMDMYINDQLSAKELTAFLEHIKKCPECYDELETLFIINEGIKYLETETRGSYDIPQMLRDDIRRQENKLKKRTEFFRLLWSMFLVVMIGAAAFLIIKFGLYELEIILRNL